ALAQIALGGPIKNKLQAVLYASCGDKAVTKGVENRQHGSGIDVANQLVANVGEGVLFQAADPLAAGSVAAPFFFALFDEFEGAPLERLGAFACGACGASACSLGFERIFAARQHTPIFDCPLTRFGERDVFVRPHAYVARFAVPHVAENPALRVPLRDLQIGAVADSVTTGLGERGHLPGGKLALHVLDPSRSSPTGSSCQLLYPLDPIPVVQFIPPARQPTRLPTN